MNYIQLKQAIRRWLGVSTEELNDETAGEIINIVVRSFTHLTETRYSEISDSFQTRIQIRDYPLPTGWSRPRSFWYQDPANIDAAVWMSYVSKDEFDATFPTSGLGTAMGGPVGGGALGATNLGDPLIYTVWAGQIQLGPIPNRAFTIFRNYWRIPPDLTDDSPSSVFTDAAWEYLLYASLVEASKFGFEDSRVPMWEAKARDMRIDLNIEDARSRTTAQNPVSEEPG